MTPKEKAEELVYFFMLDRNESISYNGRKRYATKIVDEKIETLDKIKFVIDCVDLRAYYDDVKQEIEKL